jgi:hypothetical protein
LLRGVGVVYLYPYSIESAHCLDCLSYLVIAVLSPGLGYESLMKTVMTNKVQKILDRLKLSLRYPAKSAGLFRKDGVHL